MQLAPATHHVRPAPIAAEFSALRLGTAIVAASALVAVCAHVNLVLPFTPVPVSLSNFAVLLIGMLLGPAAGCAAMVLYLAEGAMGLPVFSPHGLGGIAQLLGPTGGFLFSYPLTAAVAGWVFRALRRRLPIAPSAIVAGLAASVPTFLFGAGWLALSLHRSAATAIALAVTPFLPGECVKLLVAAGLLTSLNRLRESALSR